MLDATPENNPERKGSRPPPDSKVADMRVPQGLGFLLKKYGQDVENPLQLINPRFSTMSAADLKKVFENEISNLSKFIVGYEGSLNVKTRTNLEAVASKLGVILPENLRVAAAGGVPNKVATAAAVVQTEPVAELDKDGQSLQILGRIDDIIVLQNGYKLDPLPIEARVRELPWVDDCFLFGNSRKSCILIIKPRCSAIEPPLETLQAQLTKLLPDDVSRAIGAVRFSSEAWNATNGLCNFKGGKRRRELERFYSDVLQKEEMPNRCP